MRRASLDEQNESIAPTTPAGKRGSNEPPPAANNAAAVSPLIDFLIGDNLKSKNPVDLLQDMPVVVEVNEFTEEAVKKFDADVSRAMRTGQNIIPVVIDSYGGGVYSLFRMLDTLRAATARGFTVVTIAAGKAMSCGAVLLAAGERRFAGEDAIVMIHDVSSWNFGKLPDIVSDAKHTEYLGARLYAILDKASGKEPGYWAQRVHAINHGDLYLSAAEAKEAGLVTDIGSPRFYVEVTARFNLLVGK